MNSCRISSQRGSSPHMRGTHLVRMTQADHVRFIPAYAGNARAACSVSRRCSVHPRMRGERMRCNTLMMSPPGSSPHARGTLLFVDSTGPAVRFIPACAGNARITPVLLSLTTVHPRMRGERILRGKKDATFIGSSPHARGTLCTLRVPGLGQTVHPRMRGERPSSRQSITPPAGSSPHARGTQVRILLKPFQYRFIPACAGNAMILIDSIGNLAVHPRMRGERYDLTHDIKGTTGSSPHARGTRSCVIRLLDGRSVHPRMRGERNRAAVGGRRGLGSSPHARGTLWDGRLSGEADRFIPACAGNAQH